MKWDDFFFEMCKTVASKSKDTSTKVGCVIVGQDNEVRSMGYNGMPRGIDDNIKSRHERPLKYKWFEHAERNAIYNAARVGIPVNGCRLYVGWCPCSDCARAIIQSGIVEVLIADGNVPDRWKEDCDIAKQMLFEAGVSFVCKVS